MSLVMIWGNATELGRHGLGSPSPPYLLLRAATGAGNGGASGVRGGFLSEHDPACSDEDHKSV
jgi:hypothetical protein